MDNIKKFIKPEMSKIQFGIEPDEYDIVPIGSNEKYPDSFKQYLDIWIKNFYTLKSKLKNLEVNDDNLFKIAVLEMQIDKIMKYINFRGENLIIMKMIDDIYRFANRLDIDKKYELDFRNPFNLYLSGLQGVGKTYISIALAVEYYLRDFPIKIINEIDMFILLYSLPYEKRYEELEQIRTFGGILIYDDFGAYEQNTAFVQFVRLSIIDYRNKNNKKIIFSSNYDLSEIGKFVKFDNEILLKRFVSRIEEMTSGTKGRQIDIIGNDRRINRELVREYPV